MANHAHSTPAPTISRRNLAGAALLALAGTASTADAMPAVQLDPEAELCAEIDALEDLLTVRGEHGGKPGGPEEVEYDDLVSAVWERQKVLTDRICALPCTTPAGLRALGRTILAYRDAHGVAADGNDYPEGLLIERVLRHIADDASDPA